MYRFLDVIVGSSVAIVTFVIVSLASRHLEITISWDILTYMHVLIILYLLVFGEAKRDE